jgi:hypothetical protein
MRRSMKISLVAATRENEKKCHAGPQSVILNSVQNLFRTDPVQHLIDSEYIDPETSSG